MIKILGKEEYLKYVSLYKEMQQAMDCINYVIDCPWVYDNSHISKEDVVLDVGCGSGGTGLFMAKKCKMVYGVDELDYPAFRETCSKWEILNAKFIQTNAKELPFPEEFFDLAVSISALEHCTFEIANKSVKEISRVLKRGKRLVATVAVSPEGPAYFPTEESVLDVFTKGTGMKLLDDTLTGWKWDDAEVKNKLKEFLAVYTSYQNWLPVGVIVEKE